MTRPDQADGYEAPPAGSRQVAVAKRQSRHTEFGLQAEFAELTATLTERMQALIVVENSAHHPDRSAFALQLEDGCRPLYEGL